MIPALSSDSLDATGRGYPRPQLRRSHWFSLNGDWDFAFDRDAAHTGPDDVMILLRGQEFAAADDSVVSPTHVPNGMRPLEQALAAFAADSAEAPWFQGARTCVSS